MNDAQHTPSLKQQRAKQRALALAALTQTISLVESIAQTGKCNQTQFTECMDAFFQDDYTQTSSFSVGAMKAKRILQGQQIPYAKAMIAHSAGLMAIEKKLSRQPDTLQSIAQGLQRIHQQIQYFDDAYHPNILAAVAHLYGENISHIHPRIIVRGKSEFLTQSQNTEKIRCLLFSGIRAAWVWRSHGGHTWRLLLMRKQLIQQLEDLGAST